MNNKKKQNDKYYQCFPDIIRMFLVRKETSLGDISCTHTPKINILIDSY